MKWIVLLFGMNLFGLIPAKAAAPTVTIQTIKKIEIRDSLSYPARMESDVNASIYADADGVVTKIWQPLGQNVKRGQALITIQHTDPIYQYAPMKMSTPVQGVVSSLKVGEGTQVTKGELLATVTDPKRIRIIVEVAAVDMASLKRGSEGEFRVSGREGLIPVKVKGISPFVDPGLGTATAELEVSDASKNSLVLTPGLVGQVNFQVNKRSGIVIPDFALVYKGKESFVRILENGKSKKVAIVVGPKARGQVEILSGLKENDVIIERASGFVADGEEVKIEQSEGKKE